MKAVRWFGPRDMRVVDEACPAPRAHEALVRVRSVGVCGSDVHVNHGKHPFTGYSILKNVEFPWPVAEIVLQHHERMDGSGYPSGLTGDNICIEAKIIGVADVVESMASHRPYRPALGINAALEEIERNQGIFYDRDVVAACLRLFREGKFQLKRT